MNGQLILLSRGERSFQYVWCCQQDIREASKTMFSVAVKWSVGIIIAMVIVVIIYALVLFECYKSKTFLFAPYAQPTPPGSYFYPLGSVTQLTQEEIDQRNQIINASIGQL